MHSNAQAFLDNLSAAATRLTGIAWIDLCALSISVCCFIDRELHKLIPCRVCYGLGETMILDHASDIQVFKYDGAVLVDQLPAFFVGKISALVRYTFVHVRHYLAPLGSF